jgi:hypothetical protein
MIITSHAVIRDGDATPPWVTPGARRRMDPLQRLACAVAGRLIDAGGALPPDTAVIVSNSYGSVDTTLKFADSIAQFGDAGGSPTPFTTSVHNSAAACLGELLKLHGPCTTISHGGTGTLAALRLAHLWIAGGRATTVIVLVGDRLHAWGHRVVTALSGSPWPIGDGMAGFSCQADGSGRSFHLGVRDDLPVVDGGAILASDEALLAARAGRARRQRAGDLLGAWWPCCLAAAIPDGAVQLRECEDGSLIEGYLA